MSTLGMEYVIVTLAVIIISSMIAVLMLCSLLDKVKVTTRTIAYRCHHYYHTGVLLLVTIYTSVQHRLFPMPPSSSRIILGGIKGSRPGNEATTSTHHGNTQAVM